MFDLWRGQLRRSIKFSVLPILAAQGGGRYVRDVSPDPRAMTVNEHQSFIALPGPGFTPRRYSPRAGYFPESYRDYDTPLGEPLAQAFQVIVQDANSNPVPGVTVNYTLTGATDGSIDNPSRRR